MWVKVFKKGVKFCKKKNIKWKQQQLDKHIMWKVVNFFKVNNNNNNCLVYKIKNENCLKEKKNFKKEKCEHEFTKEFSFVKLRFI